MLVRFIKTFAVDFLKRSMFETSEQTNQRLYRAILKGKQYERIIPKSHCKPLDGGKGNTAHSVNQMHKVVQWYSFQVSELSKILKKSSLVATCQAVQDFLYWHFQYKRDEQDQMLTITKILTEFIW